MTGYDLPFTRYQESLDIMSRLEKSTTRLLDAATLLVYTMIALCWINSIIWWAA